MKSWIAVIVGLSLHLLIVTPAWAGGVEGGREGYGWKKGERITQYDPRVQCPVVRRSAAPISALIEDGLAYLLDIPLAMVSPITCPIAAYLLERLDSGPDRTYARCRKR
ncbi:MAG: hypothetical protein HY914_23065 [Desulfomonile tiedjei]|nr:hypothetical protein [Desulfomonile tiedjei]